MDENQNRQLVQLKGEIMCKFCKVSYSFYFGVQYHAADCPLIREEARIRRIFPNGAESKIKALAAKIAVK